MVHLRTCDPAVMDSDAILAAAAGQRLALAALLESLTDNELEQPSLCEGWSCRVVAGHLYAAQTYSATAFIGPFVASGFRPDRANGRVARRAARLPIAQIVARFRDDADSPIKVPVVGYNGPLADLVIHYADIAIPLDRPYDPDLVAVQLVLDFLTSGRAPGFVRKSTLDGLELRPADIGRSWGSGQEVSGRAADIVLAVTGRRIVLDTLTGAGVATLRQRLS
jgi:uncharacterized protein (TIGR03083 family)